VLVIQIDAVGPEALQGSLNQDVAMIFLSAAPLRDSDRITLYEGGASDYISGPIAPELLRAKVRVFADLGMRCIHRWVPVRLRFIRAPSCGHASLRLGLKTAQLPQYFPGYGSNTGNPVVYKSAEFKHMGSPLQATAWQPQCIYDSGNETQPLLRAILRDQAVRKFWGPGEVSSRHGGCHK
jgi:hypothetical protein